MVEKNLKLLCKNRNEERSIDFDVIKTIGKIVKNKRIKFQVVFNEKIVWKERREITEKYDEWESEEVERGSQNSRELMAFKACRWFFIFILCVVKLNYLCGKCLTSQHVNIKSRIRWKIYLKMTTAGTGERTSSSSSIS